MIVFGSRYDTATGGQEERKIPRVQFIVNVTFVSLRYIDRYRRWEQDDMKKASFLSLFYVANLRTSRFIGLMFSGNNKYY